MVPRSIFSGLVDPLSDGSQDGRDCQLGKMQQLANALTDTRLMSERWEANLARCPREKGALQDELQPHFERRADEAKRAMGHHAYRAAILMTELLADALGTWTPSPDHIGFGLDVYELTTVCEMSGHSSQMAGEVMT